MPLLARRLSAVLLLWAAAPAVAGTLTVDFLDIGQGDAILVRAAGKSVLIDAGDRGSGVVDQLRELGVERLDLVVATHPHADHIGQMSDVLKTWDVGLYLDNGLPHTTATYEGVMSQVEARGIPYRTAQAGLVLRLGDEATLTVLHPGATPLRGTRSDLNSNSVVLLLEHGDIEFLFTGDAEAPTEALLARSGLAAVDVLKVAHHGSGHSSTPGFLAAVKPTYAVISCGATNRYGHPDDGTLERLRASGAIVYRTDLSGHIRALSDGRSVDLFEGTLQEFGRSGLPLAQGAPYVAPVEPEAVEEPEPPKKRKRGRRSRVRSGSSSNANTGAQR